MWDVTGEEESKVDKKVRNHIMKNFMESSKNFCLKVLEFQVRERPEQIGMCLEMSWHQ